MPDGDRLGGQNLGDNPWKLLLDAVPPDQIDVAYPEQILTALIRGSGKRGT